MIKTFNDFLSLARAKHGDEFSYIEETFKRFSYDNMTIIHNKTGIRFEMIPFLHIDSKSGIPKDIEYKILYPFNQFLKDAKSILKNEFIRYRFIENTYRGRSQAMTIYKDEQRYYISPYMLLSKPHSNRHLYTDEQIFEYKEIINKYKYLIDFRKNNLKLYRKLADDGFNFLWSHLDVKKNRVIYSEKYLRNLMLQYKNAGKSRSLFVMEHGSEHAFIRRNNLIHLYYECGLTIAVNLSQGIYACEFNLPDGKYAYVGLTYNFRERESDHRGGDTDSAVYKFIKQRNLSKDDMIFREIIQPEDCDDASKAETEIYEQYKKDGWIMLNSAPTGSKGQVPRKYYNRENVEQMIKENNLKTVHELYVLNHTAWSIARSEGYLDELLERKTHKKLKK